MRQSTTFYVEGSGGRSGHRESRIYLKLGWPVAHSECADVEEAIPARGSWLRFSIAEMVWE